MAYFNIAIIFYSYIIQVVKEYILYKTNSIAIFDMEKGLDAGSVGLRTFAFVVLLVVA